MLTSDAFKTSDGNSPVVVVHACKLTRSPYHGGLHQQGRGIGLGARLQRQVGSESNLFVFGQ